MKPISNSLETENCGVEFQCFEASRQEDEPIDILEWANGFPGPIIHNCECRFYHDPRFGRYESKDFVRKKPKSNKRILLVPDSNEFYQASTYLQQARMLPKGVRPASAIETVAAVFSFHRQTGQYPDLGHLFLATSDIIPVSDWPVWWRNLYGIDFDRRIFLQVGPNLGIFIRDYSVKIDFYSNSRPTVIAATVE